MPPLEYLHQELRKKGVTLQLLWHEYKEKHPEGYQYSQFCRIYRKRAEKLDPCLRQEYRAGEKLFVDYAGQTMEITNPQTGEIHEAQIFVATLGASNYTFAEATFSQDLPSWIKSHVHAFEFFQGVTEILIPDNLRDAVTRSCRYEPELNATYREMAEHYGTVIIPARVGKARDKGKVERPMDYIRQRFWRGYMFDSVDRTNRDIITWLNETAKRRVHGTHRQPINQRWEQEIPSLGELGPADYDTSTKVFRKVYKGCQISYNGNRYEVPYHVVGKKVMLKIKGNLILIYHDQELLARYREPEDKNNLISTPSFYERLKLDRAAEILDTVAQHAEKNKTSYMAFLDHLLEEEVGPRKKGASRPP